MPGVFRLSMAGLIHRGKSQRPDGWGVWLNQRDRGYGADSVSEKPSFFQLGKKEKKPWQMRMPISRKDAFSFGKVRSNRYTIPSRKKKSGKPLWPLGGGDVGRGGVKGKGREKGGV